MAGTDSTQVWTAGPGPAVILVRPQMGENIGAAARAMKNFGLSEMRLVAPRDGWPNEKAVAMASRADDILDAARLYDNTPEAVGDLHTVYATTARQRGMEKPAFTPRQAVADMRARMAAGERVGILFGAEKAGLDNDDVVLARNIIHIPANPAFSSLNLGQAVLLVGYEWLTSGEAVPDPVAPYESVPATTEELQFFYQRLEAELDKRGFLKPPEKRPSMVRNIRNVFQRADMTGQEVRSLHGVISALIREDVPE
jgi:tRNA/rRNA methyltransferase